MERGRKSNAVTGELLSEGIKKSPTLVQCVKYDVSGENAAGVEDIDSHPATGACA